jgi:di/tricarboxylate transporter
LVVIIGSFFYKENKLWKYSLPMFLLYPLILVLIILLQATKYKVKWKERDLLNI